VSKGGKKAREKVIDTGKKILTTVNFQECSITKERNILDIFNPLILLHLDGIDKPHFNTNRRDAL